MKRPITSIAVFASVCAYCADAPRNILVIVADDLGREVLSLYDAPTAKKAKTPNIDALAARGVLFENVWGSPLSAPVRAAMLTGRYGHHTSILALDKSLPTSETTLFEALPDGYANALIGKWHLSSGADFQSKYGIDHFAGLAEGGGVRLYDRYQLTIDGRSSLSTKYITTEITDLAREWIADQTSPWFCWVAYNAPHTPFHLPPSGMHSQKKLKDSDEAIADNPLPYYLAMVESLDYEIGRLLKGVPDNTTIIFVGDNGTDNHVLQSPYAMRHGKGSLFETGVGIPMVVSGSGVELRGVRSAELVSAVDIFPTVMSLAGVESVRYEDGYSFSGVLKGGSTQREYNFSEILHMRFGYTNAVSDGRFKLISMKSGNTAFFDLAKDPLESDNLLHSSMTLEQRGALAALNAELSSMKIPINEIPDSPGESNDPRVRGGGAGMQQRDGNRGGRMRGDFSRDNSKILRR